MMSHCARSVITPLLPEEEEEGGIGELKGGEEKGHPIFCKLMLYSRLGLFVWQGTGLLKQVVNE